VDRFRAAILLDSTSGRAWAGLVAALRRAGHPEQAERVLARAPLEVRSMIGTVRADTPTYAPPVDSLGTTLTPGAVLPPGAAYPPDTTGTVPVPPRP
jgi:hypothetical protein